MRGHVLKRFRDPLTPFLSPTGERERTAIAALSALVLAALCAALLLLLRSAQAEAPKTNMFELAMCNISNVPGVFVALTHRKDAQNWQVEGWYAVPDWGCALIGSFMRDTIHVYAESQDAGAWKAVETDRSGRAECVDHKKWFNALAGTSACAPGQMRVRFRMLQIAPEESRLTWSIRGQ